jgi:hypothetical protein
MTAWCAIAALAVSLTSLPYDRWNSRLPFRAPWGRYTIVIQRVNPHDEEAGMRLRILTRGGTMLKEVRAWAVTRASAVPLLGRGSSELEVRLWSGGANASFTNVYFTRRHGVRNLLVFDGRDLGVVATKDLDGDHVSEIIAESPMLCSFSGYYFHHPWPVVTILGWNGHRYVDVTRRYPGRSLRQAALRRRDIVDMIKPQPDQSSYQRLEDEIAGYYANMLHVGRGRTARAWLTTHLPPAALSWLGRHDRELRTLVAHPPHGPYRTSGRIIGQFLGPWRPDE